MATPTIPQGKSKIRFIASLADFVEKQFQEAKDDRETTGVNDKLLKSRRQYSGIYDPDIQAAINEMGGTDVYRRLTAMKCNSLVSWLNDILLDPSDAFWELKATPIPDLPERIKLRIVAETETATINQFGDIQGPVDEGEVRDFAQSTAREMRDILHEKMQGIANEKTKAMEREIQDQLVDGKYNKTLYDFFYNYSVFQTAFIKGPLVRIEKQLQWVNNKVTAKNKPVLKWYAPSPLDMYPSSDANDVSEGRIFEIVRYTREELYMLQNVPHYNKEAIKRLLAGVRLPTKLEDDNIEDERQFFENREYLIQEETRTKFEGMEMWGCVPGQFLKEFGLQVDDVLNGYEAHVIKINDEVILATLNEDPLQRRPYYMSSYQYVPGSFWGISLPESMQDIQRGCNASVRALYNNLAIASGPMVSYDLAQLPPDAKITKLYPWKIFTFDGSRSFNTRKAIEFHNPQSNAAELLSVYNSIRQEADNVTSIPGFATGSTQVSGGADTATGLSILQGNMTKGIKNHVLGISADVIQESMQRMYDWNMMFNPDETIKGDAQIVIRGPLKVTTKEQKQLRMNEFLQTTNNDLDQSIIGLKRRANILREQAAILDLPVEDIVPTKEEMEKLEEQQVLQAQQQQQQLGERQANEGVQRQTA